MATVHSRSRVPADDGAAVDAAPGADTFAPADTGSEKRRKEKKRSMRLPF